MSKHVLGGNGRESATVGVIICADGVGVGVRLLRPECLLRPPGSTLATIDTAGSSGATWGPGDTIIVATNSVDTGLQQLSASGGPLTVLTRPDRAQGEGDHLWPPRPVLMLSKYGLPIAAGSFSRRNERECGICSGSQQTALAWSSS